MIDTTVTYSSGIGVMIFLGLLALIVVLQLVPGLILFVGFLKAIFGRATVSLTKEAV
jgi:hypothetical protein